MTGEKRQKLHTLGIFSDAAAIVRFFADGAKFSLLCSILFLPLKKRMRLLPAG